jgi:hypothetical protein
MTEQRPKYAGIVPRGSASDIVGGFHQTGRELLLFQRVHNRFLQIPLFGKPFFFRLFR